MDYKLFVVIFGGGTGDYNVEWPGTVATVSIVTQMFFTCKFLVRS